VAEVEARLRLEENQPGIGAAKIPRSWDDGLGRKKLNGKYLIRQYACFHKNYFLLGKNAA